MSQKGPESFSQALKQRVRKGTFAWLAFGAFLSWMFGLYWSNLFAPQLTTASFDVLQLRSLWLAVEAITLILFFIMLALKLRQRLVAVIFAGCLTCLGTGILLFASVGLSDVWVIMGIVCTGIGSALLLVHSGVQFSSEGPQNLLIYVALALLTASLLDAALLLLPYDIQRLIVIILPLVYVALYLLSLKNMPFPQAEDKPEAYPEGSKRTLVLRAILLPLIVGLAYGLMQRLVAAPQTEVSPGIDLFTILSIFLSSVIIMVAAFFFSKTGIAKLLCFVAVPIICTAFVLLPLFDNAEEAAQAICIVGFNSFYFMVWALWAGDQKGFSQAKRFVLGLFVLVGSESLGSVLGLALLEAAPKSGHTLAIISLVVVYLLLMAALFAFGRALEQSRAVNNSADGFVDRGVEESAGEGIAQDFTQATLQNWSLRYGLSTREKEVFDFLAKGRNRRYISATLVISDNTTRTHMRNIYRKLDVHSQQELIDLIEEAGKTDTGLFDK